MQIAAAQAELEVAEKKAALLRLLARSQSYDSGAVSPALSSASAASASYGASSSSSLLQSRKIFPSQPLRVSVASTASLAGSVPPSTPTSATSVASPVGSELSSATATGGLKKRRVPRAATMSTKHSITHVRAPDRQDWLGIASGDKDVPVTHQLDLPGWYHSDIDELADPACPVERVPLRWEALQFDLRHYVGEVLQHRHMRVHNQLDPEDVTVLAS